MEADVRLDEGRVFCGVCEGDVAHPSLSGIKSPDVLVVANDGLACAHGEDRQRAPAAYRVASGGTFTLRLDRTSGLFYYIVKGRVSPTQFSTSATCLVCFLSGAPYNGQVTLLDVRVDATSAAAAAPCAAENVCYAVAAHRAHCRACAVWR
jgi:hypothetical protein